MYIGLAARHHKIAVCFFFFCTNIGPQLFDEIAVTADIDKNTTIVQ